MKQNMILFLHLNKYLVSLITILDMMVRIKQDVLVVNTILLLKIVVMLVVIGMVEFVIVNLYVRIFLMKIYVEIMDVFGIIIVAMVLLNQHVNN